MKKTIVTLSFITILIVGMGIINSCAPTKAIASKSGVTLWGENCQRCHNSPPSSDYSSVQWETIGLHMKVRANLGDDEIKKIVEYLQSVD